MESFFRLLSGGEDWLTRRAQSYADAPDRGPFAIPLPAAWQDSMADLTCFLGQAVAARATGSGVDTTGRYAEEQIRRHQGRGATLTMILCLLKLQRQCCRDLLADAAQDADAGARCLSALESTFDRVELACCVQWSRLEGGKATDGRDRLELLKSLSDRVRAGLPAAQVIAFAVSELARQFPEYRIAYARLGKGTRLQILQSNQPPGLADLSGEELDLTAYPRYLAELLNFMPVLSEDVGADTFYGALGDWLRQGGAGATIDLPVRSGQELAGVLCVAAGCSQPWDQGVVRLLTQVGEILNGVCEHEAREQVERELQETSLWLRSMFQALEEAVFLLTPERELVDCNPAAERMFQYSRRELEYLSAEVLHVDRDRYQRFGEIMDAAFARGESATFEYSFKRKDGEVFPSEQTVALLRGDDGASVGVLAVVRDITERKFLEEELHTLATTDPLTGVLNRRRFLDRAREEFQAARRYGRDLAFLMLDVDHFKRINDTHGHQQGDEVLRRLSRFCVDTLRQTDPFGRLGGEEFAAVLVEAGPETASQAAERIRSGLAELKLPLSGGVLRLTVSGGLALLQDDDLDLEALMQRADDALYTAKHRGRNRVVGP